MNNFVNWNDWWTQKYRFLIGEGVRYPSFKIALNLFIQRKGVNIVETGTTRALDDFGGAGMATIFLGDFAKHYNKQLWTVDILPEAISLSKSLTTEFANNITYIVDDSLNFLKTFPKSIDLLYLDSYDYPIDENEELAFESQTHQLNEFKAAEDKLHYNSIVLLDDNAWSKGGKCKLTKEYLFRRDWECLWDDFQSLWVKKAVTPEGWTR